MNSIPNSKFIILNCACLFACVLAVRVLRAGQQGQGETPSPFPLSQSIRETGSSVTGAYEGWYRAKDGSIILLLGYMNRNTKQELDIPVGANNRIEPGGPDQGQPTHFQTGRQWGVFTIRTTQELIAKKMTWTIVANGQTNTITMHTRPEWVIEPFEDPASKNTPPVLTFQPAGTAVTGPPIGIAAKYTASPQNPLTLDAWATDESGRQNVGNALLSLGRGGAAPLPVLSWSVFRGPAAVKFDPVRPAVNRAESGKATTTATFSAAGEYTLRLQANDSSGDGGGGFQCCWTNAHVAVSVK